MKSGNIFQYFSDKINIVYCLHLAIDDHTMCTWQSLIGRCGARSGPLSTVFNRIFTYSPKITDCSFQCASPYRQLPASRTSFTSSCLSQPIFLFSAFSIPSLLYSFTV